MLDYGEPIASKNAERAVIRDVWVYTALLAVLLAAVGGVLTGSLGMAGFVLAICIAGGVGITLVTRVEFASARHSGRPPRVTRIFD